MTLKSPCPPQRPFRFARKCHPSKCALCMENRNVRLTPGDGRYYQLLLWSLLCTPSPKQSRASDPRKAPGSCPPALLTCPCLPTTAGGEPDLHQGNNSMNSLSHRHHPWASEYTPSPTLSGQPILPALSVGQCVYSRGHNTDGRVKGTTDTLARQEKTL